LVAVGEKGSDLGGVRNTGKRALKVEYADLARVGPRDLPSQRSANFWFCAFARFWPANRKRSEYRSDLEGRTHVPKVICDLRSQCFGP
jgi:hypothetical protein